jgi:hypothetical protein
LNARIRIFPMAFPRDIRDFLEGYPGNQDNSSRSANLEFYYNARRCRPDNLFIEEILEQYVKRSDFLLSFNVYVQVARGIPEIRILTRFHSMAVGLEIKSEIMALKAWCEIRFPIREHGMNYESQPLQAHEISSMKADDAIIQRVIRAYSLMLDFYGMRLFSPKTGLLDRSLPPRNYANRYRNLISECHFMPGVQFTQSTDGPNA